jgi:hypothetical protein
VFLVSASPEPARATAGSTPPSKFHIRARVPPFHRGGRRRGDLEEGGVGGRMILAYSFFCRPSWRLHSGGVGAARRHRPTVIPSARAPQDWRNRRRQTDPAASEPRQKPEGFPRGAAIAPVAVDVISRPRGGRNRSAGCRRSFGAEFPSELADESEQRAVGRFCP